MIFLKLKKDYVCMYTCRCAQAHPDVHMRRDTWEGQRTYCRSQLILYLFAAGSRLFLLLQCVLQDPWSVSIWVVLLLLLPVSHLECWDYRCTVAHLALYIGTRGKTWVVRIEYRCSLSELLCLHGLFCHLMQLLPTFHCYISIVFCLINTNCY